MVTRLLKKWLIPAHWGMMTYHSTRSSNLTHVRYPYLLSHMQCIITFNRVISRVCKIVLDVGPRALHLISCIARCRWIIIYFILLYRISNDLDYITLSVVERLPQKQLISVSVQIWNGIVLSFLSLVLLSYFHWKLSVLFFKCCYYHQCQYYFSVVNIIIIIKMTLSIIIIVIVIIIVIFRTYPSALYYFLVKSVSSGQIGHHHRCTS